MFCVPGGIMDMTPDGSPIIDKTDIDGLYIDCGWCLDLKRSPRVIALLI